MTQIVPTHNSDLTMSSVEIAELTGKRHDNVLRDIRTTLAEVVGHQGLLSFEGTYQHPQNGQRYGCYRLPQREVLILVSGYSVSLRARIIDRWAELECQAAAPQLPDFSNPVAAARAWADQFEQRQQLAIEQRQLSAENEHLKSHFQDGMKVVDFARTLNGVNVQQVQRHLESVGWLRREGFGSWRVTSKARDRFLAERSRRWLNSKTLEDQEGHYPVLLKAGAVKLFEMYTRGELPMKQTWNGQYGHGAEMYQ